MSKELMNCKVIGQVLVTDKNSGQVLLDKKNAINPYNMAMIIARGLSGEPNGQIFKMVLGNGGSVVDSTGAIVFNSPRVSPSDNEIYNKTYEEIVNARSGAPNDNQVYSTPGTLPNLAAQVTTILTLTANEPAPGWDGEPTTPGQNTTDGAPVNIESPYMFDELGLMTEDGKLLSHLVFSPIEKNAQREIIITYTLTITVT